MAGSEKISKWYHKLTFYSVLSAVLLVITLKLVFLISRYGITASSFSCEHIYIGSNRTVAVRTKVDHEYIFTVVVYAILNVLRIVEYVLLGKQFYSFFFQQAEVTFFTKHSKRFWYLLLFCCHTFSSVLLSQHLEYTKKFSSLNDWRNVTDTTMRSTSLTVQ